MSRSVWTISTIAAVTALGLFAGGAEGQRQRPPAPPPDLPSRGAWGVDFIVADPRGEFGEVVNEGFGVAVSGRLAVDRRNPFSLKAELGFINYGNTSQRVCLSPTVGCRILVDLDTSNNILYGTFGPELGVVTGSIRPYVNAGIGFAYFATESHVSGVDDFDSFANTTNFDDVTGAWTVGGGTYIQLTHGRTPLSIHLAARYHGNGTAEYLTEDDIVDEPDGSITIFPNRSETNLMTYQIGVSIGFPRWQEGRR